MAPAARSWRGGGRRGSDRDLPAAAGHARARARDGRRRFATRVRRARGALEDALALARHADCRYLEFSALGQLALLEGLNGALRRAAELGHEAAALAQRHGWLRFPASGAAHCALAICAYHQNAMPR